jgi:hypothetical protein
MKPLLRSIAAEQGLRTLPGRVLPDYRDGRVYFSWTDGADLGRSLVFGWPKVAEAVGHQKGDLGLSMTSRYAGRESMEAKAACVRAVRLPEATAPRIVHNDL